MSYSLKGNLIHYKGLGTFFQFYSLFLILLKYQPVKLFKVGNMLQYFLHSTRQMLTYFNIKFTTNHNRNCSFACYCRNHSKRNGFFWKQTDKAGINPKSCYDQRKFSKKEKNAIHPPNLKYIYYFDQDHFCHCLLLDFHVGLWINLKFLCGVIVKKKRAFSQKLISTCVKKFNFQALFVPPLIIATIVS